MRPVFLLAGVILVLSGIVHLGTLATTQIAPNAVVPAVLMGILGASYLLLGALLLMRRERALLAGIFVPLVGVLLVVILMASSPMLAVFIALDLVVIVCCTYLYFSGRATIGRVR
jgi:hypothetical protein